MADRSPPEPGFEPDSDRGPGGFAPWGTWALFVANTAVLVLMALEGASLLMVDVERLVTWGGSSAQEIWSGEVWRLFSGMFVHGAVWHLGLNMWVLLQVGRVLERVLGTSRFLLLYLASGLFGSALSLLVHPGLSVGASGAIFGVVGGLFALAVLSRGQPLSRMLLSALTPFAVATLIVGFLVPFIDNSAHVGGLLAGFLLGLGLIQDRTAEQESRRLPSLGPALTRRGGWGPLAVILGLFVLVVPIALKPAFNPQYAAAKAWTSLRAGDRERAERLAARAAELAPEDPSVLLLHGRLAFGRDEARSRAFFQKALEALDAEDGETALALARHLIAGRPDHEAASAFDPKTTRGLCDVLLEEDDTPSAELSNNCGWVMVKASDPEVRDIDRGVALAERAVRLTLEEGAAGGEATAAYLHTLAEARAQGGDPEEAVRIMDRILVGGLSSRAQWREERARFARLAEAAEEKAEADSGEPAPDLR